MSLSVNPNLPGIALASPHPELDKNEPTGHWWMHSATAAGINAKIAEGFRLFRLKVNSTDNLYSALFVSNAGRYRQVGSDWQQDLSLDQLKARAADPSIRIISIAPRVVANSPLFSIVFITNKGSQHSEYKVLTTAKDINQVLVEAKAFGGRIVDFASYTVSEKPTPDSVVSFLKTMVSAVITKNASFAPPTQWAGIATLEKIGILVAQKKWQENVPVTMVALENTGTPNYNYVLQTCPAEAMTWYYDGVTVSNPGDPDDLVHICRRLSARPVDMRMNVVTKRYSVCLVSNGQIPVQGKGHDTYAALDKAMTKALQTFGIAGGTLALVNNGRLVYAKGYGYTNIPAAQVAAPETLLRIASVSKPVTALAVLRLIQDGAKLADKKTLFGLDTKVFGEIFAASTGTGEQKKLNKITVRHLLEHSGVFSAKTLQWAMSAAEILNTDLAKPLDFDPGTQSDYRNSHYYILGLVIESVSGMTYGDYVTKKLLEPLNIKRMAFTGSLPAGKGLVESAYYDCSGSFNRISDWNNTNAPRNGGDAGAWVTDKVERRPGSTWAASPVNLLRLLASADGSKPGVRVLDATRFELISKGATWSAQFFSSPNPADFRGLGFSVSKHADKTYNLDHNGYLPGSTNALLRRRSDGFTYCWILNGDSPLQFEAQVDKPSPGIQPFVQNQPAVMGFLDSSINKTLNEIAKPQPGQESDLFAAFGL